MVKTSMQSMLRRRREPSTQARALAGEPSMTRAPSAKQGRERSAQLLLDRRRGDVDARQGRARRGQHAAHAAVTARKHGGRWPAAQVPPLSQATE